MELREAAWSDLDELMAFYQEMSRVLDKKDFLPQGNRGGFPAREMVREAIGAHGQFVGVEDGRIVAAYLLNHRCDSAYRTVTWGVDAPPEEVLILHALRVLPQYGGRGYARRLVEHAIQTARAWGQRALRLDVAQGNDQPEQLYRSCGFQLAGTATIYYEDIGVPMPFHLLELVL